METSIQLEPGKLYHIYNRGNNREKIFYEERNYSYFLSLYKKYLVRSIDTFAYCLLKNHFHLLVKIKEAAESTPAINPSQQFSNFFNSYAKSINKAYDRSGALFEGPFRRIEVPMENYFVQLVLYVHLNPQRHGFVKDFESYPYSSYQALLSHSDTFLKREEVLDFFSSKDAFIQAHRTYREEKEVDKYTGGDEFF